MYGCSTGLFKAEQAADLVDQQRDKPGNREHVERGERDPFPAARLFLDRAERCLPLGQAVVEISLETRDEAHCQSILEDLTARGYEVERD